jgi:acyl-[acyl-carrier-protein]-phospholipid O-acyltransferase/long-chain-fatty-acid--[acyl-carrier-protein] ligase
MRALLSAQFLGAFNDNAWKLFVIVLAGRSLVDMADGPAEAEAQRQTMLAFVVMTVPMMLFSLPAGAIADKLSKRTVILGAKALEVVLMVSGTLVLAFSADAVTGMLIVLGCMGLQSALFSPAKYGILPELVPHDRLSAANGSLESWTFLAIIAGTALGPLLFTATGADLWMAGAVLSALAITGFLFARGIPRVPAARPDGGAVIETITGAWTAIRADRSLGLAVIGSTWFWAVASLLGQNLIVYSGSVLGLSEAMTGVPLGVFGLGVGLGSVLAGKVSASKVEAGLIPLGAMGLGLLTLLLGVIEPGFTVTIVLMSMLGVSSGFLIVPLDALIQWRSPADRRGGVIALTNVFVFGGMLVGSLGGGFMAAADISAKGIFVGAAIFTLIGTGWALTLLPEAMLRLLVFVFTHVVYRMRVDGMKNVPRRGGVLLACNHVSFVDGMFLMGSLDRRVRFIIDQGQFNRRFAKPILKLLGAIPISQDGGTREVLRALRTAGESLDEGHVVCIFPEGQITRTGALQPFRRGLERIVKGRDVAIVPVHLDRVWGSIFSFSGGRFLRKFPKQIPYPMSVSYGEPLPAETPLAAIRDAVAELGEKAWYARKADRKPIHRPFLITARRKPWAFSMVETTGERRSRLQAAAGAVALARTLRGAWTGQQRIGILLPPSVGGALTNVAVSLAGKTSVNLNYTAGTAGMTSAAEQAGLETVVTSRAFLEKAGLELPGGVGPLWIEDIVGGLGLGARLAAAAAVLLLPARLIERYCGAACPIDMDDVATVIFSSGSTGEPKGVMLTHFNVDSNVDAVSQVFRLGHEDCLLGILPLFHSFGFMALWFSVDNGVPMVFHPNPLDAAAVGMLVARDRVTLLLATPTFLQLYARRCAPHDFGSLRIVLAGAEKLSDKLANDFEERFGIRPLEGYGATECSPVIATSIPAFRAPGFFQPGSRRGAVGPPVPGMAVHIVDPDTHEPMAPGHAGLLLVRGPNVMKGYLGREDLTSKVLRDGWYETGDIALQDEEGFLHITDRLSRFSKIGGEMVPHGKVEEALHEAYGGDAGQFAVTGIPDERKGERLAVLTLVDEEEIPRVLEGLAAAGLPNLFIPRKDSFVKVDEIPMLGTGKTNLRAVTDIAKKALL